jgi:hypothetical protein
MQKSAHYRPVFSVAVAFSYHVHEDGLAVDGHGEGGSLCAADRVPPLDLEYSIIVWNLQSLY